MAPISPPSPPKVCMFMGSTTVYDLGLFRPFWARKREGLTPKVALQFSTNRPQIAKYWTVFLRAVTLYMITNY